MNDPRKNHEAAHPHSLVETLEEAVKATEAAVKPVLRGISHAFGVLVAIPAVVLLWQHAREGMPSTAVLIYGGSLIFLLGTSALYHTPNWSPRARKVLRRIDHSAIFVLIAGTYTPFLFIALPEDSSQGWVIGIWSVACLGIFRSVLWPHAPRPVSVTLYIITGYLAMALVDELHAGLGSAGFALLLTGGILYTIGALAYAKRWPDPLPKVFGYHEVFHLFVLGAASCHFICIWNIA